MAGYCTSCGGSGYRRPAKEKSTADLVARIARMDLYDLDYSAQDGCDAMNSLIREARKIVGRK